MTHTLFPKGVPTGVDAVSDRTSFPEGVPVGSELMAAVASELSAA